MAAPNVNQFSATTTAAQMLPANGNRQGLLIKNTHASATLYFGFGSGLTASNGFAIAAGGSFSDVAPSCPIDAIWVVASAGTIVVDYYETNTSH